MDRFFAPRVAGLFLLAPALGISLYALDTSAGWVAAGAVLIGIGIGAEFDIISLLVSRYFGRFAFGAIYAAMFAAFQSAAFGSWILGRAHDRLGGYTDGLWLMSVLMMIGAAAILLLPPYPRLSARASQAAALRQCAGGPAALLSPVVGEP